MNIVSGKENGDHDHSDYEEEYKFIRKHVYAALDGRDESLLPENSVRNENLPCLTADNLRNLMIKEKTLQGEWANEEHRHLVLRALQCFKQRDINRNKGKNEIKRSPPTFQQKQELLNTGQRSPFESQDDDSADEVGSQDSIKTCKISEYNDFIQSQTMIPPSQKQDHKVLKKALINYRKQRGSPNK